MILTIIGFFEAVMFLLVLYFAWKVFKRVFLPLFVKEMINRIQNHVEQQVRRKEGPIREDGDVTIESEPKKKKKVSREDGEYIDYEEIK
jgi:hypothetical protein